MPTPTFADVYGQYRDMSDQGTVPKNMSLDEFSRFANDATGTQNFSAGEGGGLGQAIQKGSYWIDKGLEATHIPQAFGSVGQKAVELFGGSPELQETGRQAFAGAPRGLLEMAPMLAGPAGAYVTAGLLGAHAYGDTGSLFHAGAAAASLPLMGMGGKAVAGLAESAGILKPVLSKTEEILGGAAGQATRTLFEQKVLEGAGQKTINFASHQLGAQAAGALTNYATDAIANRTWDPYEGKSFKDWMLETAVGNAPYMLTGIPDLIRKEALPIGPRRDVTPRDATVPPVDVSQVDPFRAGLAGLDVKLAQEKAAAGAITDDAAKQAATDKAQNNYWINRWALEQANNVPLSEAPAGQVAAPTNVPPPVTKPSISNVPATPQATVVAPTTPVPAKPTAKAPTVLLTPAGQVVRQATDLAEHVHGTNDLSSVWDSLLSQMHTLSVEQAQALEAVHAAITSKPDILPHEVTSPTDVVKVKNDIDDLSKATGVESVDPKPIIEQEMKKGIEPEQAVKDGTAGAQNVTLDKAKDKLEEIQAKKKEKEDRIVSNNAEYERVRNSLKPKPFQEIKGPWDYDKAVKAVTELEPGDKLVDDKGREVEIAKNEGPGRQGGLWIIEKDGTPDGPYRYRDYLPILTEDEGSVRKKGRTAAAPEHPTDAAGLDILDKRLKSSSDSTKNIEQWRQWRDKTMAGGFSSPEEALKVLQGGQAKTNQRAAMDEVGKKHLSSDIGEVTLEGAKSHIDPSAADAHATALNQRNEAGLQKGDYDYRVYKDGTKYRVSRRYSTEGLKAQYESDRNNRQKDAVAKAAQVLEQAETKTTDPDHQAAQAISMDWLNDIFRKHGEELEEKNIGSKQRRMLFEAYQKGEISKESILNILQDKLAESDISHYSYEGPIDDQQILGGNEAMAAAPPSGLNVEPVTEYKFQKGRARAPESRPTVEKTMGDILRRSGASRQEIGYWTDNFKRIMGMVGMPEAKLGQMVDTKDGLMPLGLAEMNGVNRMFWLRNTDGTWGFENARQFQTIIPHELFHLISAAHEKDLLPKAIAGNMDSYKQFLQEQPKEALEMLRTWKETLPSEYRDLPIWDTLLADNDYAKHPEELFANTGALWALSKMADEGTKAFGCLAPPEGRGFIKAMGQYARRIIGALRGGMWLNADQFSDTVHGTIDSVKSLFDEITDTMKYSEEQMANYDKLLSLGTRDAWNNEWYKLTPSRLMEVGGAEARAVQTGVLKSMKEEGPAERMGKDLMQTMQGLQKDYPLFGRVTNQVMSNDQQKRMFINAAWAPMCGGQNPDTGALNMKGPTYQAVRHLENNRKASEFFNGAAQLLQRTENQRFTPQWLQSLKDASWPPGSGKDLKTSWTSLDPKSRDAVQTVFQSVEQSMDKVRQITMESLRQDRRNALMMDFGQKLSVQWAKAPDMVQQFTDALDHAMDQDPQRQMLGNQQLAALRQSMGHDELFNSSMDYWMQEQKTINDLDQRFKSSPGHMSLIRAGKWHVQAFRGTGKAGSADNEYADNINSLDQYEAWKKERQKEGYTQFTKPKVDEGYKNMSFNDDLVAAIQEADQKFVDRFLASGAPDEAKQAIQARPSLLGELGRIVNAKDVTLPGFMKGLDDASRRKVPGSMDMVQTHRLFVNVSARANANRAMESRVAYEMTNPELSRFPDAVSRFKQMYQNYQTPDTKLGSTIQKVNAIYYLGGSAPAALTNLSHSYLSMMPEAVNRGDSTLKATLRVAGAVAEMGKYSAHLISSGLGIEKEHQAIAKMSDPEERALMRWINDIGFKSFGGYGEMFDHMADSSVDLNAIGQTGAALSAAQKAKSAAGLLANFSLKAFAATDHFNKGVAALVGFRQAREGQGQNYNREQAFQQALDFARTTTYSVGKANRPALPFEGKNKILGHMAFSLGRYTLGWLNQLAGYTAHWKGSELMPLSPEQRSNARRAALAMLGSKMAASGLLGMPFVGAALKLLEKATGEDYTGKLWDNVGKLLDGDSQEGGGLASAVMMGGANAALANAGVPVDMGSRWAMGGVLGFNMFDGYSGDAVFGPTGGIVSSALSGLKSVVSGDLTKAAADVSPPATRRAIRYWQQGGQIETTKGAPVPSSPIENWMYVAGFDPQRLTYLSKFERMKAQATAESEQANKREASDIAGRLQTNPEDARLRLNEIAQNTGLQENPKQIASRVAKTLAEQNFPVDIRNGLPKQQGEHLMRVARELGLSLPQAAHVARTQYVDNLMRMLGQQGPRVTPWMQEQDEAAQGYTPELRRPGRF